MGRSKKSDFNSSSKRVAYILKELYTSNEYRVITDFAEELSVSRNTINNDLKAARKLLEDYDVSIASATGRGIKLVGSVLDKRLVYINLAQDYFNFEYIDEAAINEIYQILSNYNQNNRMINHVIKVVDALMASIQMNETFEEPIPFYSNAAADSQMLEELVYFIESHFKISLSQYEKDFVSYPFNLNNSGQYKKSFTEQYKYLFDIFDHMVESVKESFVIELNREFLYTKISNHLFHLINRSIFHVSPKEMFYGEVEKKYPFSFEVAKVAAKSIGSDINRKIDSIEVDYLTLYFEMVLRSLPSSMSLNVAIISDAGIGTTGIIQRQIDSVVGQGTQFTYFSENDYAEADLSEFFLIFTSIPLKNPPEAVPVIRISNILSDQWLSEEIKRVIITNPNLIHSTLYDVYTLDHTASYMENLSYLMEPLEQEDLINEEFKQRVKNREEKQLTVFDNGVAFPHEVNPGSDRILLNIGIFDQEYMIEKNDINIMLLLAVPENLTADNEQQLIELYDLIFRLSRDQQFKEDISSISSKSDFIAYIKNRRLSL
ncbi:BglG family transcription antiterminator [Enterococcus lactis]